MSEVVAILGAGRMGAGIAAVAASAGAMVKLHDRSAELIERGIAGLRADYDRLIARGKIDAAKAEGIMGRISAAADLAEIADATLVIEAVFEDVPLKHDLFKRVEAVVSESCIITSNTSSISIPLLGGVLQHPERFAGFHFFNPPQVMKLVEVVAGARTDEAVLERLVAAARAWGKLPVRCVSSPGFIANRVARPFYAEALRLLEERAIDAATLDATMREAGGFPMGPCELMDMIGHDVNFAVTSSVWEATFRDPRYRPNLVQQRLVEAGLLGRKSGRGFYDYAAGAAKPQPHDLSAAPYNGRLVVMGHSRLAAPLVDRAKAAGLVVEKREGEPGLELDGVRLELNRGASALERSLALGMPVVLFDLARDFATASRLLLALPAGIEAEARDRVVGFFTTLGIRVAAMADRPGMLVLRTVAMIANEAEELALQGIATEADIDTAAKGGLNYPEGPLAWGRRLGAGLVTGVIERLHQASPDGHFRVSAGVAERALQQWDEDDV